MKKRNFAAVTALLLFIAVIVCTTAAASNIPTKPESIFVYDEAEVISEDTEKHIIDQNTKLTFSTGAQVVIAAVKTTGDTTIRDYAGAMFTEWSIGDPEKNNGVLVVLAIDDDDYWVTQGSGIEERLTAGSIKVMLDSFLEPYFAAKDYDKGVAALFDKLVSTLETIYSIDLSDVDVDASGSVEAKAGGSIASTVVTVLVVIVVVVIFILIVLFIVRNMSGGGYRNSYYRPNVTIPPRSSQRNPSPKQGNGQRPRQNSTGRPAGTRPSGNARQVGSRPSSNARPTGARPNGNVRPNTQRPSGTGNYGNNNARPRSNSGRR